jgi:sulfur-oxidizing protein SoxY
MHLSGDTFDETKAGTTRRVFLRSLAASVTLVATAKGLIFGTNAAAQSGVSGLPLPDEPVEATLKRLFGNRPLQTGDGKIKLELPLIAEDGGNVAISVDTNLPVGGQTRVSNIYIIADKNRRPMLAKFSFMPESGRVFIATSIRLATNTDVRAVVEMSDGTLYAVSKNVRVTISGCDLPPQS